MKIKTIEKSYTEVCAINRVTHEKPKKANIFLRTLARVLSSFELMKAKFSYTGALPDKAQGPCLVLMNHSSFIDLKMAFKILFPRPFGIVCAHDALIGKKWLMRSLGCIPTKKFLSDLALIHDMKHMLARGVNVLMYPEAGYSFDGKATVLPERFARLIKMLGVPVVYIESHGAFSRDPLYNCLRIRKVKVSAEVKTLVTKDEISELSVEELDARITKAFSFDNFAWQKENNVKIDENFRAEGLEKVLYKCPACGAEGKMLGHETNIRCTACAKEYTLTELGEIEAVDGNTEFSHIPDWYAWQRAEVRRELEEEKYNLDTPVEIGIMKDYKAFYRVGSGRLIHGAEGFHLTGCGGDLDYKQKPLTTYSLNADFHWYEQGDVISIGDHEALYFCFPPKDVPVSKIRLATEELYKLHHDRDFHLRHSDGSERPERKESASAK